MFKMFSIFQALKAGKSLKNPAAWKNVVLVTDGLAIILTATVYSLQFFGGVDVAAMLGTESLPELINDISKWGAEGLLIINTYFFAATSEKVGLP